MGSGLFHLTLAMLRLNGPEGLEEATKLVEELQPELQELLDRRGDKKPGDIIFNAWLCSLPLTIKGLLTLFKN
jgi:hypothetical protein